MLFFFEKKEKKNSVHRHEVVKNDNFIENLKNIFFLVNLMKSHAFDLEIYISVQNGTYIDCHEVFTNEIFIENFVMKFSSSLKKT